MVNENLLCAFATFWKFNNSIFNQNRVIAIFYLEFML